MRTGTADNGVEGERATEEAEEDTLADADTDAEEAGGGGNDAAEKVAVAGVEAAAEDLRSAILKDEKRFHMRRVKRDDQDRRQETHASISSSRLFSSFWRYRASSA